MDPTISAVPENYEAYLRTCNQKSVRPMDRPGFEVQLDLFLDQVSLNPSGDKGSQVRRFLAKVRLGPDPAHADIINGDVDTEASGGDIPTPLKIAGPPVSRSKELTSADPRSVFRSPIKLNLEIGKIEGLDPDRALEAVGRMPSELLLGGQLFVVHRGSADQMSDFRVDIGEAKDLNSYPGRPTRTASGELSVQVHGIGTFIFPFTQEPYMVEGLFIEAVTGHKSEMPRLIRPASISPKTQWPHLGHMLRQIDRD